MEQARIKIKVTRTRGIQVLGALSHASFASFLSLLVLLSLGGAPEDYLFLAASALSAFCYFFSQRSRNLGLASVAWIILGIFFIESFVSSEKASYITITLSVLFLLASYEFTRFSFVLDSVIRRSSAKEVQPSESFRIVIRKYSISLALVFFLSMIVSIVIRYALGVIIINPAPIGVTVFVVAAILLVAFVTLGRE